MVVIRLSRGGSKGRPFFNIVVSDKRVRRDGRFIERLGFYNPTAKENEESIRIAQDRLTYWKSVGAQPSQTVRVLMNNVGIWEKFVAERPAAAKDSPRKRERTSAPAPAAEPAATAS